MSINEIKDIIKDAEEIKQEQPEPLRKAKHKPVDFPIDSLPTLLKNATLALHDKIQAPLALCAQSVLAAVNLVVQGHADIELPTGQIRPISIFFLTIAESGERKSSCDNEALFAIEAQENKLREQYSIDIKKWQNDNDAYESQRQSILRKNNLDYDGKKEELDQLKEKPPKPLTPLLRCSEPTFEGLCKLMKDGYPSQGIFSAEGGQFIAGHGMKAENKIRTAGGICELWDGKPIPRVRAEENFTLNGKRLAIHLMVQPDIAALFLSDPILRNQGMLSRILTVAPMSTIGQRMQHELKPESLSDLKRFNGRLSEILNMKLPLKPNCINELKPRLIKLTPDANKLYKKYADYIEGKMGTNGELEPIKGFANKLGEHALRLGATIALFNDINPDVLDTDVLESKTLEQSIKLADFYASEQLRLYDDGMTNPDIILAEKLLAWIDKWDEENISLPDIYQGMNVLRRKEDALRIVRLLENHGWLRKNDTPMTIRGQNRKDNIWKIIKANDIATKVPQTREQIDNLRQTLGTLDGLEVDPNDDENLLTEERAAIIEFDGEFPRSEAEFLASEKVTKKA